MVVRASMYLREKIVNMRLKKKSYENIRLELLGDENIKISKKSIVKICIKFFKKKKLVDEKKTGRKHLFNKPMLEYLNKLIVDDREIKLNEIKLKLNEKFSIRLGICSIYRAAGSIKWKKKGTRYCQLVSEKNSIKRRLYCSLALTTNLSLENTIFIDECKIELETHLPHRWRKLGERMYKVGVFVLIFF